MKRKMTLLAFAGSIGFLGASGLAKADLVPSAAKPSRPSNPARASPVKPAPASQSISRRVLRQNDPAGSFRSRGSRLIGISLGSPCGPLVGSSVEVEEFVEVQDDEAERLEGTIGRIAVT